MPFQPSESASPPRAALAFRVGIVGHRPNRLPKDTESLDMLRQMLRSILEEVKAEILEYAISPAAKTLYSNEPIILRAVSPLAEGTDRIFAQEAIDLGYELLCPMPFSQEEFEKDFLPPYALEQDSRERFRLLQRRAREGAGLTTFELDGERSASSMAYAAAGRVVLNQSDLLIAVWDGHNTAGGGGTLEILQEAVRYRVPVMWIDAQAPCSWQLLHHLEDLRCLEESDRCVPALVHPIDPAAALKFIAEVVRRIVREEIVLPVRSLEPNRAPTTQSNALQYFRERKRRFKLAFVWTQFSDVVGGSTLQLPSIRVLNFEVQLRKVWPTRNEVRDSSTFLTDNKASANEETISSSITDIEDWINRRLRPHYAWSDKLAELYADAYRSAYVLTYVLSAMAVFIALLPMAAGFEGNVQTLCIASELVILLIIVLLLVIARARHWHEHWMDYRLLAELIRQLRILVPLGGGRPFPRMLTHLSVYGNLIETWMYWHMRAIARATGVPEAKVTRDYVLDCLKHVSKVVGGPDEGQIKFHKDAEIRSSRIANRLHAMSTALFSLTIVAIGIHMLLEPSGPRWLHFLFSETIQKQLDRWLVLSSATLPALAAALAGIRNQGEFARLAKRSAAMADSFKRFAAQITALESGKSRERHAPKLLQVIILSGEIAEIMVDEVADWRIVFIDRPPTA